MGGSGVGEAVLARREVDLAGLRLEAERLWRELPCGAVVWLSGEMGSGKTALVLALTEAAGAETARSPTYALVHEYLSPEGPIAHVDCYRLRRPEEAGDLDLLSLARRSRVTLIEWPERAGTLAPAPDRHFRLSQAGVAERRVLEEMG